MENKHHLIRASLLLLAFNIALLVFVAFIPDAYRDVATKLLLTGIFVTSVYVIGSSSPRLIILVVLLIGLQWLARLVEWEYFAFATGVLNSLYILYLVARMAMQFAGTRRITVNTLLLAVNGYLLIGLICALYAMLIADLVPQSFYLAREDVFLVPHTDFHTFVYYTFINLTTVGFGDIIPVTDAARALAILLAVAGPLYLAIVVAFLVGKYVSTADQC
jgi:voltage-gated potassium channel